MQGICGGILPDFLLIFNCGMKLIISLGNDTLSSKMRCLGYAPEGRGERTGEFKFWRSVSGRRFPRFHVYASQQEKDRALLNLHLDQKAPVYRGVSAHSGEYEGQLVEQEVQRILGSL